METYSLFAAKYIGIHEENAKLKKENLELSQKLQFLERERDMMKQQLLQFRNIANIDLDLLNLSLDLRGNPESKMELDKVHSLIQAIMDEDQVYWQEKQSNYDSEDGEESIPQLFLGNQRPVQPQQLAGSTPAEDLDNLHPTQTAPLNLHKSKQLCKIDQVYSLQTLSHSHSPLKPEHKPQDLFKNAKDFGKPNNLKKTFQSNGLSTSKQSDLDDRLNKILKENTKVLSSQPYLKSQHGHENKAQGQQSSFMVIPTLDDDDSLEDDDDDDSDDAVEDHSWQNRSATTSINTNNSVSVVHVQNSTANTVIQKLKPTALRETKKTGSGLEAGPPSDREVKDRLERIIRENVNILYGAQLPPWNVFSNVGNKDDSNSVDTKDSSTSQPIVDDVHPRIHGISRKSYGGSSQSGIGQKRKR